MKTPQMLPQKAAMDSNDEGKGTDEEEDRYNVLGLSSLT